MNAALTYNAALEDANLQRVSFRNAFIVDTDLTGANLNGAEFDGAALENTDLSGASLVPLTKPNDRVSCGHAETTRN